MPPNQAVRYLRQSHGVEGRDAERSAMFPQTIFRWLRVSAVSCDVPRIPIGPFTCYEGWLGM
jgi:hypothetical protein